MEDKVERISAEEIWEDETVSFRMQKNVYLRDRTFAAKEKDCIAIV